MTHHLKQVFAMAKILAIKSKISPQKLSVPYLPNKSTMLTRGKLAALRAEKEKELKELQRWEKFLESLRRFNERVQLLDEIDQKERYEDLMSRI